MGGSNHEDGRFVAFRSNGDGNAELYGIAEGGSNVIHLTRTAGTDERCPAWLP
jgi:Tol biopolymer transport system component